MFQKTRNKQYNKIDVVIQKFLLRREVIIPAAAGIFNGYPAGNADAIIHLDESKMAWLYGMISSVRERFRGNYCGEKLTCFYWT